MAGRIIVWGCHGSGGIGVLNRIARALERRRAARKTAEALVWRLGSRASEAATAMAATPGLTPEERQQLGYIARLAL